MPALSTGAYRFPMDQAANIALSVAVQFLQAHHLPELVRFVLFDETAYQTFSTTLQKLVVTQP
jgi:O-acetyl-ADP-ribose deacetylase (regulator of RNase III)